MVREGSVKMAAVAVTSGGFEEYERELEALLREPQHQLDRERELNIYRSGSAPPTVEGSLATAGGVFGLAGDGISEEDMRSHPAYLSYYYSNDNLNPRLPPPMVSKEDWRVVQRFRGLGGIGDRRRKESWNGDGSSSSLFALQPHVDRGAEELIRVQNAGLGARRKSFADVIQEDHSHAIPISHPISRNVLDNIVDPRIASDSDYKILHNGSGCMDSFHSGGAIPSLSRAKSLSSSISSFASAVQTPARSATPDFQMIGRSTCPRPFPVGGSVCGSEKKTSSGTNGLTGVSAHMADTSDVVASLSSLTLSNSAASGARNTMKHQHNQECVDQAELLLNMSGDHRTYLQQKVIDESEQSLNITANSFPGYADFTKKNGALTDVDVTKMSSNGQVNLQKQSSSSNLYSMLSTAGSTNSAGSSRYQAADVQHSHLLPAMLNNQLDAGVPSGGVAEGQYVNGTGDELESGLGPIADPFYAQYGQGASDSVRWAAARMDSFGRNFSGTQHMDLPAYQKAYLEALAAQQKLQFGMPFLTKSDSLNLGLYGNPTFGLGMPYQASPISSSVLSSLGGSSSRQSDRLSHFPSIMRSPVGGPMGSWNLENNIMEETFVSSLLDEFKNNKTRSYELSEIVDHIMEFSMDQFGSRFIQQKLETASTEEKNLIFPKILPHARSLMTDVFGNYVIQKFFEHGTEIQRKQLASQLIGHVLPLSLQMYGCRVIQKALEVVEIEQQTKMVLELDGSIMKCVRDQNGNHVIQKCIERVPQERIQFIIKTFYGQVIPLSSHPYGCRVIQRVLEYCDDPETQSTMMEEILTSVCTLAQDQYGNYVVQHVLQHGKPEERSAIINKLIGQIVKMSQQKFASNVVEKCLTYGTPEERQLLINEMLGSTDENEPLQAMMKDQFGNYVVQKVLETCDDQNRELILSRIKVHLNALKKYTYGKHIVARVEKLIATGERRIGIASYSS